MGEDLLKIDLSRVPKPQFNYSVPSDNTLVNTPIYRGEVKKEQRFVPRQTYISADNRTNWQKELGQKEAAKAAKLEDLAKILEKGLNTLGALGTFYSPSTWVGPTIRMAVNPEYRDNGQDYSDRVLSGEGTGNAVGNLATDVITFGLPSITKSSGNYLWKRSNLWINNRIVSNAFNKAYKGTYNILEPLSTTIVSESRPIQVGEPYIRINPTWTWANEAVDVYPKGKPDLFFLLIKDNKSPGLTPNPNGEYSVHFKTTRTGITPQEKEKMFKALEEQIPEGAKVSTWGTLTPGGYHGVNRFGNLFGYPRVGTRQADIPIYLKPFKSELDWSPKSWFGGAAKRTSWTPEDEAILASHVPEYNQIELTAKANGNWLKMKDGSTWKGDPREWIMRHSKNAEPWETESVLYTGVPHYRYRAENFPEYEGRVWTGAEPKDIIEYTYSKSGKSPVKMTLEEYNNKLALWNKRFNDEPYMWPQLVRNDILSKIESDWKFSQGDPYAGGKMFSVTYPKNSKVNSIDALGRHWGNIDNSLKLDKDGNVIQDGLSTDSFVRTNEKAGFDISKVLNVKDNKTGIPFNETIIHSGIPRKSFLGNNGDFNLKDKNIYRVGIPTLFGGTYLKQKGEPE